MCLFVCVSYSALYVSYSAPCVCHIVRCVCVSYSACLCVCGQDNAEDEVESARPILYKVGLGMGYLELPQGKYPSFARASLLAVFDMVGG